MTVFVDTSALYALLDRADANHKRAVRSLITFLPLLITCRRPLVISFRYCSPHFALRATWGKLVTHLRRGSGGQAGYWFSSLATRHAFLDTFSPYSPDTQCSTRFFFPLDTTEISGTENTETQNQNSFIPRSLVLLFTAYPGSIPYLLPLDLVADTAALCRILSEYTFLLQIRYFAVGGHPAYPGH